MSLARSLYKGVTDYLAKGGELAIHLYNINAYLDTCFRLSALIGV